MNTSAYDLLCDGNRDCPVDIDEGDQSSQGGRSFNPTLLCCELLHNYTCLCMNSSYKNTCRCA